MAKLAVGDMIHYYTHNGMQQANGQGAGPYPAIVTQIYRDTDLINVKVFPPFRPPFDEGNVEPKQEGNNQQHRWYAIPVRE